jgi:phage terminase large subunit-like protein
MADAWYDQAAADKACLFFEKLVHIKGPKGGQPFTLEPWQQVIVRRLFGWKRADGTRVYRFLYLEVPRGNGKSAFCAGLALYMLFCDKEHGAEVYSCALDREMASLVYEPAKEMVARCPMLAKRAKIRETAKRIVVPSTASFYRPLPGNESIGHGFNVHFFCYDELHLAKTRHLYDAMVTAMGKRKQPIGAVATTAGSDRTTICWELHCHALDVIRDPSIDPSMLAVIYAADPEDDWTSEETWRKANPNLGVSVELEYLREACERAKISPAFENSFRRLHLNQWTEQDVRVIPLDAWRACSRPSLREEDLIGRRCWAGLDMASTRDITAFVKVFELPKGELAWCPRYWLPKGYGSDRDKQDRRGAMNFAERKLITLTEGNEVDYGLVIRQVMDDCTKFRILGLGVDPWNATMPLQTLVNLGYPEERRHKMTQSYETYNEPLKRLLGLLASRRFVHNGDPVLEWMASNTAALQDPSGNIRPDKSKSGDKIDGICAGLMGMALWIRAPNEPCTISVYETRGVRSVGWEPDVPELPRGDDAEAVLFDGHDEGPKRQSVEWEDWEITHNG